MISQGESGYFWKVDKFYTLASFNKESKLKGFKI